MGDILRVFQIISKGICYQVMVDDADYEMVARYRWYVLRVNASKAYIRRGGQNHKQVYLHREILGVTPKDMDVDHINGDTLDNRRCNLRLATKLQNMANRRLHINNTSGFKGVTFDKRLQKWNAGLAVNKKHINLGRFDSLQDAADAYDVAAVKYFGEFAQTNAMLGLLKDDAK